MKYKKYPNGFINSINNKKYIELSKDEKKLIKEMYETIEDEDVIKVKKIYVSSKKILSFNVNQKVRYATLLSDECELLYEDGIYHFVTLLKKNKYSQSFINNFLLLFWCDFTLNNTGKRRLDVSSFFKLYPNRVMEMNKIFNQTINIMNFIDCLLFQDEKIEKKIDYLIYKDNDTFKIMSKKEAKIAISMKKNYKSNGIYIGPFCLQSKRRNLDFNKKYEYRRSILLVRWYNYKSVI